jgi:hypothetical protein
MSTGWHTVHVRVNDAATGQPTPVRIRFVGPDGQYLAPLGRLTHFATGRNQDVGGNLLLRDDAYAYIDGRCEIFLPPDPITVEVHKGPEYVPIQREVILGPGKLALRLAVERWIDLRQEGWYSGDTAVFCLSPHAALMEAAAEDVAVVNLLVGKLWDEVADRTIIPNSLAFSGQKPALEAPGYMVVVNTNNSHWFHGSLGLLNCHRMVLPLSFEDEEFPGQWRLADWCDQCHRKGGLVTWRERDTSWREEPDGLPGEGLADLILGKIDALEADKVGEWSANGHEVWYDLLNCGCRVPLVGGSTKDSNELALGCTRTYARLQPGEALSYKSWIEAIRAGRTFVTNGPLLSLTVNGQDPGGTVSITPEQRTVHVRAEARSWVPFTRLEIVANGRVIAARQPSGSPTVAILEEDLSLPGACWLAARCWGIADVLDAADYDSIGAHTSPVHVAIADRPFPADPGTVAKLNRLLDGMLNWVDRCGTFNTERERQQLVEVLRDAQQILAQKVPNPLGNGQHTP